MFDAIVGGTWMTPIVSFFLGENISPFLAMAENAVEEADLTMVLGGVLLSLVAIYIASKAGGEFCQWLDLPP